MANLFMENYVKSKTDRFGDGIPLSKQENQSLPNSQQIP